MWGVFTGWLPGLTKAIEAAQPGIVHTPADMQAESDAPDVAPAQAVAPPFGPEPGAPARPEVGPRMAPPPAAGLAEQIRDATAAAMATEPEAPRTYPNKPVDVTATLQSTNQRLRRELATARADAARYARQLAAGRQLAADLESAGIGVSTFVDVAGTRVLRLTIPERKGPRDLLFELPPLRTNPLYDLDGSTTSGGLGGASGPSAGGGQVVAALPEAGQGQAVPGGQGPDAPL